MAASIQRVTWHQLRVSPKTIWSFIELTDDTGRIGVGEATLGQREPQMRDALDRLRHAIVGRVPSSIDLSPQRSAARALPDFAIVSALDQALWDLVAQQRGVSVSDALGARQRDTIPVYANINRGIASRSADGFAMQARRAVADGFSAIKIAPFDDVALYGDTRSVVDDSLLDAALARIAAVRDAIGPDVDLMVDCHWRLNREIAEVVLNATAAQRLYWLECPVPETPAMLSTLRELRGLANARGVRLAGCEEMSLRSGFSPFLDAGAYDVMMPDAKYVGGLREMLDVAELLKRHGVAFSPHNPSGPVCHAASVHVCAASSIVDRLEMQYAETPLFSTLVGSSFPSAIDGSIEVPRTAGLGAQLDRGLVEELQAADGFAKHAS